MTAKSRLGTYLTSSIAGESFQAFLPPPLPPDPPLDLQGFHQLMVRAGQAIGRLDRATDILPDGNLLLYYYIRKEAVLSSQIEGTQSSLADLLLYESNERPKVPLDDVQEVSSYVAAMEHGLARIREGFPLSLRLIREMHQVLLQSGRGSNKQPGSFRTSQNWIGGSRPGNAHFVPPPPERLMECLSDFESYLHLENRQYASLIDAGLIHVQFETIHPFLDGNGRIGRLLITFFLITMGDLKAPTLYLSLFFKNNRKTYYDCLTRVREVGDWETWVHFYLTGIAETAEQVLETTKAISDLLLVDGEQISQIGRARINVARAHELLSSCAVLNVKEVAEKLDLTPPTARSALVRLRDMGIAREIKGQGKERLYIYEDLIAILDQGTEPIEI